MALNRFIISFFYLGDIKYAPGTITSFFVMLLCFFIIPQQLFVNFTFIFCFLGFISCYYFAKNNSEKDPSYIVIDEVAGMMISLLMIPKVFYYYFLAFLLFRFFDILKPSFITTSENLPNGIGIMLDDILSGLLVYLILLKIHF